MNRMNFRLGMAMCALLAAPAVVADDVSGFTLVPGAGYMDFADERNLEGDLYPSLGLGYQFNNRWTTELVGIRVNTELDQALSSREVDLTQYRLDALYTVNPDDALQGYLVLGGGRAEFDPGENIVVGGVTPTGDIEESFVNYGVGLKRALTDRLAWRGDIRGVTSLDDEITDVAFNMGISYMFAQTNRTIKDADGDGVSDKLDQCPATPAGVEVDDKGCALDSDNDGVADHIDQCPNTPAGVEVNANGCAKDDDGDGVPNHLDECPNTAAGAKVDDKGCYLIITEDVKVELDVEFDTNSAAARPQHQSEVQRVVRFMREHPLTKVVVEGHTDDRGSAAYNQQLSEKRAATIAEQLISQGVSSDRVTSVGVGEARPRADNATEEGRQRNRRVVAVVSAREEKRAQ
ncbi:MAG: OmpA family protein [Pseudomonadales bacterium]